MASFLELLIQSCIDEKRQDIIYTRCSIPYDEVQLLKNQNLEIISWLLHLLSCWPRRKGKNNHTNKGDVILTTIRISQSAEGSEYSHVGHSLHVDGHVC